MSQDATVIERLISEYVGITGGGRSEEEERLVAYAVKVQQRLARGEVEIVEQGVLMPKAATIPDGWGFDDLNNSGVFVGNWDIRIKRGEPIIYQRGHVLFIRQFELFSEKDRPYYERISRVPGQSVLVVIGFQGKREGFFTFVDGVESGIYSADAEGIAIYIRAWLERSWHEPMPDFEKGKEGR